MKKISKKIGLVLVALSPVGLSVSALAGVGHVPGSVEMVRICNRIASPCSRFCRKKPDRPYGWVPT
jgi:hypothetical protein